MSPIFFILDELVISALRAPANSRYHERIQYEKYWTNLSLILDLSFETSLPHTKLIHYSLSMKFKFKSLDFWINSIQIRVQNAIIENHLRWMYFKSIEDQAFLIIFWMISSAMFRCIIGLNGCFVHSFVLMYVVPMLHFPSCWLNQWLHVHLNVDYEKLSWYRSIMTVRYQWYRLLMTVMNS